MKKNIYKIISIKSAAILFFVLGFILSGCENDITESTWTDPAYQGSNLPQPIISSINPSGSALAGVDAIELTGSNFSSDSTKDLVYFGSVRAKVLEASATRLLVRAPNSPADTLIVKVAVLGAQLYSENQQYKLLAAAQNYAVKTGRKAFAITVDQNENIYASATEADAGIGVIKIAPDGTVSTFAPSGETFLTAIKLAPNGYIYGLRPNLRAVFEIQPGIASKAFVSLKSGSQLVDLDFDKDSYMWVGGRKLDAINRVTLADKTIKEFPFLGDVRALKVYNDYIYVAVLRDGQEKVIRLPLNPGGELGAEEEYYNLTAKYPNRVISSMLISSSGRLYLGTNSAEPEKNYGKMENFPILIVNIDKTENIMFDVMQPDAVFAGPVFQMAWGAGDYFYYTRSQLVITKPDGTKETAQTQEIVKVTARESSAPYYGRGDQ